ncbi:hypothetical protein [Streptomyces sp. NPDC001480]|uniref:hypothetical protein n=1 Tax=Streptomyces sp. NPDC001480 TaxID=3364577 RepID=UPI0036748A62
MPAPASLVPVDIQGAKGDEYVPFLVEQVVDCLDTRRSSKPKRRGEVKKVVFLPERLPADLPAFRLPQSPRAVQWNGWAADRLIELTGDQIEARLLWSEDPTAVPHPDPWGIRATACVTRGVSVVDRLDLLKGLERFMDLQVTVIGFPNSTPLASLDRAWKWSLAPVLNFAGALTSDGTRLLQMNQRGKHDERLAAAVLAFAREHESELIVEGRFLTSVGGFDVPGYDFDSVAVVVPEVHRHHKVQNPDLMPLTYIVFPGSACEFSGRETLPEAEARYHKMLPTAEIERGAVPFLTMRFDNARTGGGSTNPGRALTYPEVLLDELQELENTHEAFVEYENHEGKVWRVEWSDGAWAVTGDSGLRATGRDELRRFVERSLY